MNRTIDLGGAWRCRADADDRGVRDRWFVSPPSEGWSVIDLPAPAQRALGLDHKGVSWYQRQEPAPVLEPGQRLWVCCESAATDAEFWVNGTSIGRNVGDSIPFQFEVPNEIASRVASGVLNIVARVDQIHAPPPAPGVLVQNGHITKGFHDVLSLQHAGLWGRVTMRVTGASAIRPGGVRIIADPESGKLRVLVELVDSGGAALQSGAFGVTGHASGSCDSTPSLRVRIADPDGHEVATLEGDIPHGATGLELQGCVVSPSPWSPETPSLYNASVEVLCKGVRSDARDIRFGFRSVRVGGPNNSRILLNDHPFQIRGVLHWGHEPAHISPAPSRGQVRAEFAMLRRMGFNCVCLCMVYLPEHYYDLADEMGMLIWQEHPVWKSPMGDEHIPEYQRLFAEYFRRDRNHASVILVSGSCEHENFNKTLGAWWWDRAKAELPDRLVQVQTAFIDWADPDRVDLYDEHVYDNSGRWIDFLDDVQAKIAGLTPRPFVMGETIIANAWPDTRALSVLAKESPRRWYLTKGLEECAALETRIEARWGSETLARFRRQADAFAIGIRKFQVEAFRAYENHAGWVMNHIRDVPACRCGYMDDLDRWRYTPERTLPWLADATLLLRTPGQSLAAYPGAATVGVRLTNFAGRDISGEIELADDFGERRSARIRAEAGHVADASFTLDHPEVRVPTKRTIEARLAGVPTNSWGIWIFPRRHEYHASDGVRVFAGAPFSDAEREIEFEERSYSSGWGLRCVSWTPRLPDPAALLPGVAACDESHLDAKVLATHRLTSRVIDWIALGGRAVLLASRLKGGLESAFINFYGQVPLVIEGSERAWPISLGESEWIVDLIHHDLSRRSARAIPTEARGLLGQVEPIVRLIFTHDSGVPRHFDAVFSTRIGRGMLVVSCVDHASVSGGYLLDRLVAYAGGGELPSPELSAPEVFAVEST
ncbi:MAG: hypothetical protein IT434_15230 [Phycisphaerales bacterium]|jgi:hypothetical protein|nr:hypothetical protein [Phycisphaerales bacterium]